MTGANQQIYVGQKLTETYTIEYRIGAGVVHEAYWVKSSAPAHFSISTVGRGDSIEEARNDLLERTVRLARGETVEP